MNEKKTLLEEMNQNNVFVSENYIYFDFVEQLAKLQELTNKRVFGDEYHPVFRISDAAHELRKKAALYNLTETEEFNKGIASLKVIEKEIAISASGKKAEDRVERLLRKYVSRNDFESFQGIYLANDIEDTEIDNVILTKDGIIILEVKNIKSDVTISEEGRLFIGKDCSYEQTPLAEKMSRKRRLFKEEIKKVLKQKGFNIDIFLDSYVVFNEPYNTKCYVKNYSDEKWCKSNQLATIVNKHHSSFQYTENEYNILKECLSEFETSKKKFVLSFDPNEVKSNISNLISLIEEHSKIQNTNQEVIKINLANTKKEKSLQKNTNSTIKAALNVSKRILATGLASIACLVIAGAATAKSGL